MILREVISLNCTNVIALLMSPNTILLIELSMYGTVFQTLLSRLLARYPFVVSWLNLIWVVFVLIFVFFLSMLFCVITVYCARCFFSMYFIGVSGLRVLPLLVNWIELNLCAKSYLQWHPSLYVYCRLSWIKIVVGVSVDEQCRLLLSLVGLAFDLVD